MLKVPLCTNPLRTRKNKLFLQSLLIFFIYKNCKKKNRLAWSPGSQLASRQNWHWILARKIGSREPTGLTLAPTSGAGSQNRSQERLASQYELWLQAQLISFRYDSNFQIHMYLVSVLVCLLLLLDMCVDLNGKGHLKKHKSLLLLAAIPTISPATTLYSYTPYLKSDAFDFVK